MFYALFIGDIPLLARLGTRLLTRNQLAAGVLCLDRVLSSKSGEATPDDLAQIAASSREFLKFIQVLHRLTRVSNPCSNVEIRRLLNVVHVTADTFSVSRSSLCYSRCSKSESSARAGQQTQQANGSRLVARWTLEGHIRKTLADYLERHVDAQEQTMASLHCLRPCLTFAMDSTHPDYTCKRLHTDMYVDGPATYNHLVRIHLLQVEILDTLCAVRQAVKAVNQFSTGSLARQQTRR